MTSRADRSPSAVHRAQQLAPSNGVPPSWNTRLPLQKFDLHLRHESDPRLTQWEWLTSKLRHSDVIETKYLNCNFFMHVFFIIGIQNCPNMIIINISNCVVVCIENVSVYTEYYYASSHFDCTFSSTLRNTSCHS